MFSSYIWGIFWAARLCDMLGGALQPKNVEKLSFTTSSDFEIPFFAIIPMSWNLICKTLNSLRSNSLSLKYYKAFNCGFISEHLLFVQYKTKTKMFADFIIFFVHFQNFSKIKKILNTNFLNFDHS